MKTSFLVFVGSGIGGVVRHLFNGWITVVVGGGFPIGILLINIIGSTLMGVVAGWFAFKGSAPLDVRIFLTTGILGGFTTFSAFSLDAALLYERGKPAHAAIYIVASVMLSIAGLFLGMWSMRVELG
jgi:CrcB protein